MVEENTRWIIQILVASGQVCKGCSGEPSYPNVISDAVNRSSIEMAAEKEQFFCEEPQKVARLAQCLNLLPPSKRISPERGKVRHVEDRWIGASAFDCTARLPRPPVGHCGMQE